MDSPNDHRPSPTLTRGARIDLAIDKLAFGGKALGKIDGFVVFVDRALPGQRVRVEITRKKSRFAEARVVELLAQSPVYTPPFCPHFGVCGGCAWQDLAYEEQLRWKRLHVQECLKHLGGLTPEDILPPVPSPQQQYYRNKMEFAFGPRPWPTPGTRPGSSGGGACALGLHVADSFHRIFNLEDCFLQSPQTAAIVRESRRACGASGLPAYDPRTRRGFWRFLVVREGKHTGQTLVNLITTDQGNPAAVDALAASLASRFPDLTTVVHSRSLSKAQVASGEAHRTLWGPGYIEERLGGLHLRVSPQSFLQTNTAAAEGLYKSISRLGEFTGRETVWDLYCGAGSIALFLAPRVHRVVGFELVPEAVNDAYANSRLNGLDNCRFIAGDLKGRISQVRGSADPSESRPDVIITDPPRAGMHPEVVQAIQEIAPRCLIYVSCNPATLARDLALLQPGYEVATVQPFDLFPHTTHIECVVRLDRRDSHS